MKVSRVIDVVNNRQIIYDEDHSRIDIKEKGLSQHCGLQFLDDRRKNIGVISRTLGHMLSVCDVHRSNTTLLLHTHRFHVLRYNRFYVHTIGGTFDIVIGPFQTISRSSPYSFRHFFHTTPVLLEFFFFLGLTCL